MQVDFQFIADLSGCHIVVGVDIQGVVILAGADVSAEDRVHIEIGFHVKIQQVVYLADLLRKGDIPRGEVARRRPGFAGQPVFEPRFMLKRAETAFAVGEINGGGNILYRIRFPAPSNVDSGNFLFVKVQIKHACDFAGGLQMRRHHLTVLFGGDRL